MSTNRDKATETADRANYGEAAQAFALLAVADSIEWLARAIDTHGKRPTPVGLTIRTVVDDT